jgi:hypothetical protein
MAERLASLDNGCLHLLLLELEGRQVSLESRQLVALKL